MGTSISFDPATAAASVGSGLLTQLFYKKNLERQVAAQERLMDKQVQSEKDLYDYQMNDQRNWNEYDEQLGKMYDAGINPLASDGSLAGAGAGTASIGSAGLGSPGSVDAPQFNFVDSILNALKGQEIKIHQKQVDKDVQLKDEEIANARAERDILVAKKSLTEEETKKLSKDMEQINAHIMNEAQRVRNETNQTLMLYYRLSLDMSHEKWLRWNANRDFGLSQQSMRIQDFNARTQRYSVAVAERTLAFQERRFNKEYDLSYKKTMSDIERGSLDSVTKFIESNRSFGVSGQVIYKLTGVLDSCASWLRKEGSKPSNFDKASQVQKLSEDLVNELQNMTVMKAETEYKPQPWTFRPKEYYNSLNGIMERR